MLQRCIASVAASGVDVVVVDNSGGSTDPGSDRLPSGVTWLGVPNDGFGAAVNAGIAEVRRLRPEATAIAVVNDDVVVRADWLDPLVAALDADPALGAVQPKLLLGGTEPVEVNSVGVELDRAGQGHDIGLGDLDDLGDERFTEVRDIDIFTGGAVLFRGDFLADLGGFDERYFLYYEDVDLALRGAERGWRYRCAPASTVEHWPGSSTDALGAERRRLQDRNRLWVAFRFGSPRQIGAALWLSIKRLRHEPRTTHAAALVAGVAGAPLRLWERSRRSRDRAIHRRAAT